MAQNSQNFNIRPNMTESARTSGKQQNQNYHQQTYHTKILKKSGYNNVYDQDHYLETENIIHQHHYYPETYVEIDTGFKKFKNNQIIALQQLRQQYQILRNLPIDQKIQPNHKNSDSISSSVQGQSRSQATSKSKVKKDHTAREVQLLILQKKQLQIVINNSMKKIEELLHQQMQFKKQIHALKIELQDKSSDEKYELIIKNLRKNQFEYQQTIEALKRQQQRLKNTIFQLNEKVSRLQSDLNAKDQQIRRLHEQKRRQDDSFRTQKDKFFTMQIQFKRMKMQYQILEKQKESEIRRLIRQNDKGMGENMMNATIKALKDQIQLKDKRYHLLLDQLNMFSGDSANKSKDYQQLRALFETLLSSQGKSNNDQSNKDLHDRITQLLTQNRRLNDQIKKIQIPSPIITNNTNNQMFIETIKTLLQRFSNPDRGSGLDESVKRQLQTIKNQVQNLKLSPEIEKKLREQFQTIHELNKIIQDQNLEKIKFMEELKHMKLQYDNMFTSNDSINHKLGLALQRQMHLKKQIGILKNQLQLLISTKGDLTASKAQNFNLKMRVVQMQRLQDQIDKLRLENQELREKLKKKQQDYQQQVRVLRRKFDQTDFQVNRAKKQGQLNIQLLQRDYLSQTSRFKLQADKNNEQRLKLEKRIQQILKEHSQKLRQLSSQNEKNRLMYEQRLKQKNTEVEQIRIKFQERIFSKNTEIDNWKQPYEDRLSSKDNQIANIRKQFDLQVTTVMSRHQLEMSTLMKRIDVLNDANERFMKKNEWYLELQREVLQLRRKLKYGKTINESVDHLWQIKQAQYGNIHEIIRQLKE